MSFKQSVLFKDTPAFRKPWMILAQNTSGKVSSAKWVSSMYFCNAFVISFFSSGKLILSLCVIQILIMIVDTTTF